MLRSLFLALSLVGVGAACGGDGTATTTAAPATTSATTVTTGPPATAPTTTTAPSTTAVPMTTVPGPAVIVVEYENGEAQGVEGRVSVETGEEVRIEVTSDVADRVHVHGYDLFADVAPGMAAVIEFTADIPGIFEVEMEDSHVLLFHLEVG